MADPIGDGVRPQCAAISATHHLSLTAWVAALLPLHPVGSRLWETPSSHWLNRLLEGYGEPNLGCSLESAAWGGVERGRWVRTCAQESYALIWCWGRADVERLRCRIGRGRSTLHWTSYKQQEERQRKCEFERHHHFCNYISSAPGAARWHHDAVVTGEKTVCKCPNWSPVLPMKHLQRQSLYSER